MALVRVWNDNDYPHKENFKGKTIRIDAHSYIEMEREDAVDFRGQFTPIEVDGAGKPKAETRKMIRIEKIEGVDAKPKVKENISHLTGEELSPEELEEQAKANKHLLVEDEELEKKNEIPRPKRGRPRSRK